MISAKKNSTKKGKTSKSSKPFFFKKGRRKNMSKNKPENENNTKENETNSVETKGQNVTTTDNNNNNNNTLFGSSRKLIALKRIVNNVSIGQKMNTFIQNELREEGTIEEEYLTPANDLLLTTDVENNETQKEGLEINNNVNSLPAEEKPQVAVEELDRTQENKNIKDVENLETTKPSEPLVNENESLEHNVQENNNTSGGNGTPNANVVQTNHTTLNEWDQNITADTSNVPDPDLTEIENAPEVLQGEGQEIEETRSSQTPNYNESIESSVSSIPETENEPLVDVNSIENQTENIISPFQNRLLPEQQMPALIPTPAGVMPRLGDSLQLVALENEIRRLENEVLDERNYSSEEIEPSENEIRLNALREQAMQLLPEDVPEGEEQRITITDQGEPPRPELPEEMQASMGDVIARILTNTQGTAQQILDQLRQEAFPNNVLAISYPEIGNDELPQFTTTLRTELEAIATEAGFNEEELQQKIAEQVRIVEEQEQMSIEGLERNLTSSEENLEQMSVDETSSISGVRDATDAHIQEQQDALDGNVDPEVIRARATEIRTGLNRGVGTQNVFYDRSKTRRDQQLDRSKETYLQAYRAAALREIQRIREGENTEGESNDSRIETVRLWKNARITEINDSVRNLKTRTRETVDSYKSELREAKDLAITRLDTWETEQIGTQRSWWERLIDSITSWAQTAESEAEAWEEVNIQESHDALAGNVAFLANARQRLGEDVTAERLESFQGLSEEQRAILETYYSGETRDGIGAVAAGVKVRLKQGHRQEIQERFMNFLLRQTDPASWQKLSDIARSRNAGFAVMSITDELYAGMHGGVTGLGTDEDRVYRALAGLSPLEGVAVRLHYQHQYRRNLDSDIESEFSDEERQRADALLDGNSTRAVVAELEYAMNGGLTGIGTDEDVIMNALRGKTEEERRAIVDTYREMYGRDLNEELDDELSGHDFDRATALMEGDTAGADAIALDQAMNGDFFEWGTDEAAIESTYSQIRQDAETDINRRTALLQQQAAAGNWSPERIRAEMEDQGLTSEQLQNEVSRRNQNVEQAFNDRYGGNYNLEDGESALRAEFEDELSGGELNLASALADNDQTSADAARIAVEREGWYADDDTINDVLENQYNRALSEMRRDEWPVIQQQLNQRARAEGWDEYRMNNERRRMEADMEQRARPQAQNYMDQLEDTYDNERGFSGGLRLDLAFNTSGHSYDRASDLLNQGGYLSPVQQLEYATRGAGTDEERINQVFAGKTPEEIEQIRAEWAERNDNTLDEEMEAELSGRDEFDTQMLMHGIPRNRLEDLRNMQERVRWEEDNQGVLGGGQERLNILRSRLEYVEEQDRILSDAGASEEQQALARLRFGSGSQGVQSAITVYREQLDAVGNAAATAGAIVVAVAITVASAGTLAPGAGALIVGVSNLAVVAGGSALAGVVTSVGIKALTLGGAYGQEDILFDLGTGVVDVAAAIFTAGVGDDILRLALVSRLADSPALSRRVLAYAISEGGEEIFSSAPSAIFGNLINDQNWENGNPLANILLGTISEVGVSAVAGLGISAGLKGIGHIRGLMSPSANVDLNGTSGLLDSQGQPIGAANSHLNPDGTPRILDSQGRPIGSADSNLSPDGTPRILDSQGRPIGSADSNLSPDGTPRILDSQGRPIGSADSNLSPDGTPRILDSQGRPIGSADSNNTPTRRPELENPDVDTNSPNTDVDNVPSRTDTNNNLEPASPELQNALPASLRDTPIHIDPDLPGNTVRVHYDRDANGLITNIFIRAGRSASPVDIQLHAMTVRLMRSYGGLVGRIRRLINRFRLNPNPLVGSTAWEAQLELEKLPRIIENRMRQLQNPDLDADVRASLEADVRNLEAQVNRHQRALDDMDLSDGRGYVAADGVDNIPSADQAVRDRTIPRLTGNSIIGGESIDLSQYSYRRNRNRIPPYEIIRRGGEGTRLKLNANGDIVHHSAIDIPPLTGTRRIGTEDIDLSNYAYRRNSDGRIPPYEIIRRGGTGTRLDLDADGNIVRNTSQNNVVDGFSDSERAGFLAAQTAAIAQGNRAVAIRGVADTGISMGDVFSTRRSRRELRGLLREAFTAMNPSASRQSITASVNEAMGDILGHRIIAIQGTSDVRAAFNYRGTHSGNVEIHHIIPLYLGGGHNSGNLIPLESDLHDRFHEFFNALSHPDVGSLSMNRVRHLDLGFGAGYAIVNPTTGAVEIRRL